MHRTGGIPQMYLSSMFHVAVAACLLELFDQLEAHNIFEDTVIELVAEFCRSPRARMYNGQPIRDGSDHGWEGAVVNLFSGCIPRPTIIGNLMNNGSTGTYPGVWGKGAPVSSLGRQLDQNDVMATIAAVLGTANPVTSRSPLVRFDNGNQRNHISFVCNTHQLSFNNGQGQRQTNSEN